MTCGMRIIPLIAIILLLGGCEKALFPDNTTRSPYERYDAIRGRQRQAHEENAYGGSQPAIRDRLKPLGEP